MIGSFFGYFWWYIKPQTILPEGPEKAKVIRIVDGDTIIVRIGGTEETVRLLGIDAPESVDPGKAMECFAKEASVAAATKMSGQQMLLENDSNQPDRDVYGRLLRYVYLENGTNINRSMIEDGFAREYAFKGRQYEQKSDFREAEKVARENRKGLWGKCEW